LQKQQGSIFVIENNEVGTRIEDHAGIVPAWTSLAGMWNNMAGGFWVVSSCQ
jgi:hypothetical protein